MKNYIPDCIAELLIKKKNTGTLSACVIFVDISGFTALTQTLVENGKEGAEVLSQIINDIFTPSIKIIYNNAGFVSTFAGDAFTAVFQTNKAEYSLNAAFEIVKLFKEFGKVKTKFGEFDLGVKIGLTYGNLKYGIIDAEIQKTFYFRGEAINGCAESEHKAESMQIIADHNFTKILKVDIKKRKIEKKWFILSPTHLNLASAKKIIFPNIPDNTEKDFIPNSVLNTKDKGEFREIVSVFVSFKEKSNFIKSTIQVIKNCHAFGGYFNKVDFGDKGGVMLILFGAPTGKEKLYQRAADFVLSMNNIPDFGFRAGISTGIAFCGIIGSELRKEYSALGSVVNLSARLMMKASWSTILTGHHIAQNLPKQYDSELEKSTKLKGFSEKIKMYILKAKNLSTQQFTYSGNFIGRQKETENLRKFIKPIFRKKFAGIIYLDGTAGIGKSRFVHNFIKNINDADVFYLHCDQILQKSFNPFENFLKIYFEQTRLNKQEENKLAFKRIYKELISITENELIRKELLRTESVLGALIGLEWENSLYSQLSPKGRYENTLYSVKNFFIAQTLIKPIILILEDSHWIDNDTLSLFDVLIRNIDSSPIVILALCRPNDDGSEFNLFKSKRTDIITKRQKLRAFDHKMMHEMLIDKFGTNSIPESTSDFIWEKSGGNPFFVEQLILYLTENKFLDNKFNLKSVSSSIPQGISRIIIARIDRLSSKMKQSIKTASILGTEFALKILEKMLISNGQIDNKEIENSILEGEKEQIWESFSELSYIFKNAMIRDAVYGIQLKRSLRKLHELAGNIIEELYQDNLKDHYEEIANHYDNAENNDKSVYYFEKSGDQARDNFQNKKAVFLYDKLLGYLNKDQENKIIHILLKKGDILELVGKWNDALMTYKQALKLAEKINNQKFIVDSMVSIGFLLNIQGKAKKGEKSLNAAVKIATKLNYSKGIASAYNAIGSLLMRGGDYIGSINNYKKSLDIKQELNDKKSISTTLGNIGGCYYLQGDSYNAMDCYKKQLKIGELLNDKSILSRALSNMGIINYYQKNCDKAMQFYDQSLKIFDELGDKRGINATIGNIGVVYSYLGNYDKAIECYQRTLELKKELGDKKSISTTLGNIGIVYINKGEFEKAIYCFHESINIANEFEHKRQICISSGNLANVYMQKMEFEKALENYDKAIFIGRKLGIKYFLCAFLFNKANILFKTERKDETYELNQEALRIALESERKDIILNCKILDFKCKNDKQNLFMLLKDPSYDKEDIAEINYELWAMTNDSKYKNQSVSIYRSLYEKIKKYFYLSRIKEMEKFNK